LVVSVVGLGGGLGDEPVWTQRVDADGLLAMVLIDPVSVAGLTTIEAEAQIKKAYDRAPLFAPIDYASVRRLELGKDAAVKAGPAAAGELLEVSIPDLVGPGVQTRHLARVQEDGRIAIPMVERGVKVEGMRERDVAEAVSNAYRDAGLIERAEVFVLKVESAEEPSIAVGPVGAGDLLIVTVYDIPTPGVEMVTPVRVGGDGTAYLPFVGPVRMQDMTEIDAAAAVTRAFLNKNLAKNAAASVLRVESGQRPGVRLGPIEKGDLLRVAIENLTGPGWQDLKLTRVGPAGQITLPYVGAVDVAGRTEAVAAEAVAKAYRDKNIMQLPGVSLLKVESAPPVKDGKLPDLPDVPTRPVHPAVEDLLEPRPVVPAAAAAGE
jgi:protein involved in polysaccharide export with SLBB domain